MDKLFKEAEDRMGKTLSSLKREYSEIRAGRANPNSLDKIMVDYYGTPTPINQMAAVAVVEARTLTIQPWDASTVHSIEKAIQTSDLGINPQTEGKIIRLNFPQLTEDRRKDIAKDIKKMAEEAKVSIRSTRRDVIDKLKKMEKASDITEDDLKDGEDKIQKKTDKFIKNIENIEKSKEQEILEI